MNASNRPGSSSALRFSALLGGATATLGTACASVVSCRCALWRDRETTPQATMTTTRNMNTTPIPRSFRTSGRFVGLGVDICVSQRRALRRRGKVFTVDDAEKDGHEE